MAYKIEGSILTDEMETIAGAEVMEMIGPFFPKTKTDDDGKFSLSVGSAESEIQISIFGYITTIIKAKDFMQLGYVELVPEVYVSGNKKNSNFWLYALAGASVLTAMYFALRKPTTQKTLPKKVTIA